MRPLEGMRVIDLSSYFSGPFASLQLSDMGADVIKVEAPAGDPYRRFGVMRHGVSIGFANIHRGKRSMGLDLTDGADRSALLEVVADADVVLTNWRPGVAERLGISDEILWERNARLVLASITGYGSDGPAASLPAFDALVQARSGLARVEGGTGRPRISQTFIADKVTSLVASESILAALLHRERTGRGLRVDVAMLDALAYFNFPDMLATRTMAGTTGGDVHWSPETLVRTNDGYLVVAPSQGKQIKNACIACGHPEWVDELRHIRDYHELGPKLMALIESVTAGGSMMEWQSKFESHDVPVAPVFDLDQHLGDPQIVHNRLYGELDDPRLGPVRFARFPTVFTDPGDDDPSETRDFPATPFPDVGHDGADGRSQLRGSGGAA